MDYQIPKQKVYVLLKVETELYRGYLYVDIDQRVSDYLNNPELLFFPIEIHSAGEQPTLNPFTRVFNKNYVSFIEEI